MFIKATFNHMTSSIFEVIQSNNIENLLVQRHVVFPETRSEVVGSQRDITRLIGCMHATGWIELLSVNQV